MDVGSLSLIKPKRLSSEKLALIDGKNKTLCLKLGATSVVTSFENSFRESVIIPIKSLYSDELDDAIVDTSIDVKIPNISNCNEITITAQDIIVLGSISALGEDEFFFGCLDKSVNQIKASVAFYQYYLKYDYYKIINQDVFSVKCDWNLFYYLFQIVKNLTGKKTDIIKYSFDKISNKVYFTNKEETHFIIVDQNDPYLKIKKKYFDKINSFYKNDIDGSKEILKLSLSENFTSDDKNLFRPFGDSFNIVENKDYNYYYDKNYQLYINKIKEVK